VAQAMGNARLELSQMLELQTAVLAYIDVFFITGLLALALVPAALLMSGVKTK
jgi:DHA2 family multidrug resistance protein